MRKVLLLSTALTLGALNPALAGGPVVVQEEKPVVVEKPASSKGILIPLLLVAAVAAIVAANNKDDTPVMISDIRLKEDIRRVGTNHLGLGVYQYRYQGCQDVWEGVMAQEVEVLHPGAIKRLSQGFKAVDYARLGLTLHRVS